MEQKGVPAIKVLRRGPPGPAPLTAKVECKHCHSILEVVPAHLTNVRVPESLPVPPVQRQPISVSRVLGVPVVGAAGPSAPAQAAALAGPADCTGEVLCPVCDTTFKTTFERDFAQAAMPASDAADFRVTFYSHVACQAPEHSYMAPGSSKPAVCAPETRVMIIPAGHGAP